MNNMENEIILWDNNNNGFKNVFPFGSYCVSFCASIKQCL